MPSCSEGIAFPNGVSSVAALSRQEESPHTLSNPHSDAPIGDTIAANIARAEALNHEHGQRGRSWALPGRAPALCWSGRGRWLLAIDVALATDEGRRLCRERHLSPATARAIARACADFADSGTGRHLTASNRTLGAHAAQRAGRARPWCHDVVTNARRVFELLGLAVEVVRGRYLTQQERLAAAVHHDCVQLRAASTWALTLVRRWQVKSSLPRRGSTGSKTPRSRNSPNSARKRAQAPFGRSTRHRTQPRPLAAHVVTAQLVARTRGLDNGKHLGSLVDVIAELVDCQRWTGGDLATVLNEDARINPRDWPDHIANPAGFLRHRLGRIADRLAGPSPSEIAAKHHRALRAEQRERVEREREATAQRASTSHVAATMAKFRDELKRRRRSRDASA